MREHVDLQFIKIKIKKGESMYIPVESVLLIVTQKSCKGLGS